jgi:hypothetical protein
MLRQGAQSISAKSIRLNRLASSPECSTAKSKKA